MADGQVSNNYFLWEAKNVLILHFNFDVCINFLICFLLSAKFLYTLKKLYVLQCFVYFPHSPNKLQVVPFSMSLVFVLLELSSIS